MCGFGWLSNEFTNNCDVGMNATGLSTSNNAPTLVSILYILCYPKVKLEQFPFAMPLEAIDDAACSLKIVKRQQNKKKKPLDEIFYLAKSPLESEAMLRHMTPKVSLRCILTTVIDAEIVLLFVSMGGFPVHIDDGY
eukprot:Gb_40490 [translate_table: standard]